MHYGRLLRQARGLVFFYALLFCFTDVKSQLPTCASNDCFIYGQQLGSNMHNYNPSQPVSYMNPVYNTTQFPGVPFYGSSDGLAVISNLNAPAPTPTFYTVLPVEIASSYWWGYYCYFNGTIWVNTGHTAGYAPGYGLSVPGGIGGGKKYIYNADPLFGYVYRYDGTGDAINIGNIPYGIGDVIVDDSDYFYLLNLNPAFAPYGLAKYDSNANLVKVWTPVLSGPSYLYNVGMAGMAVYGSKIYFNFQNQIFTSTLTADTIYIAPSANLSTIGLIDMASCAFSLNTLLGIGRSDTVYHCQGSPDVVLTTNGGPPCTWTVLQGPAVITGSGQSVSVSADTSVVVTVTYPISCDTAKMTDTFRIIVPKARVDAGANRSITGCDAFVDTLKAMVYDTTAGLDYSYLWTPAAAIASGDTTLSPVITPADTTTYVLTVSVPASQGGCSWTDSVTIAVEDLSSIPDFSFDIHYGCRADTVYFTNLSVDADWYRWNFADNTGDTATNPVHIYTNQGIYNVRLFGINQFCTDTVEKLVDTQHPLSASFIVDDDTVCEGALVSFTNTSTYTEILGPASFWWNLADDGITDTSRNTSHTFNVPGTYDVMMIVTDFVPCSDTAYRTITVDSLPSIVVTASDSSICEGGAIVFTAFYTKNGLQELVWYAETGDSVTDVNPWMHGFDSSGFYTIRTEANYRACPDTGYNFDVEIKAFPELDLGGDTTICLGERPIVIRDLINERIPGASWQWSNGDTTSYTTLRHPATYTARVTINGCSTDDSITLYKDCYLDIPNVFTPNGDGVNDYFLPRQLLSRGLTMFRMQVLNRWGQVIFETDRIDGRGWDGKYNGIDQSQGVFVYLIEAGFKNGGTEKYQGNVTLIR